MKWGGWDSNPRPRIMRLLIPLVNGLYLRRYLQHTTRSTQLFPPIDCGPFRLK
jgi:hypothetical protein